MAKPTHHSPRITVQGQDIALHSQDCDVSLTSAEARKVIDELRSAVSRVDDQALWTNDNIEIEPPSPWARSED